MKPKRSFFWFVPAIVLCTGFLIYGNDAVLFDAFDKTDKALWPHQRMLGRLRHQIGYWLDEFNPFFSKKNILRHLETYELTLSPADIKKLYASDPGSSGSNDPVKPSSSRKAELRLRGVKMPVSVKLHGDMPNHWTGRKKSFQIRFDGELPPGENGKRLFIIPEDRQYLAPLFAARLSERVGLPTVKNAFVAVKINGIFQGIYYTEEHLDETYLERHGMDGAWVSVSDHWIESRPLSQRPEEYVGGVTYNAQHHSPFDLEISNLADVKSASRGKVLSQANDLFGAIRSKDVARFESLIDIPAAGALEAWRTVLGDSHCLAGDNLKMVYLFTSGKFTFVPRSEGHVQKLEYVGGGFEAELNKKGKIVPLLEMFARSDKIRSVRNEWLYDLTRHETELLALYDSLTKETLPLLKQDRTLPDNSRELTRAVTDTRKALRANLARLKKQFSYHRMYVNAVAEGNAVDLTFIPDSSLDAMKLDALRLLVSAPGAGSLRGKVTLLKFEQGLVEPQVIRGSAEISTENLAPLFEGVEFYPGFDEALRPKPNHARYRLVFEGRDRLEVGGLEAKFSTVVTRSALGPDEIYTALALAPERESDEN